MHDALAEPHLQRPKLLHKVMYLFKSISQLDLEILYLSDMIINYSFSAIFRIAYIPMPCIIVIILILNI